MARSLLRNGFKVLAFDKDPEKLKSVISEGAAACSSLADMKNARAVIVMVNNMKQANDVVDEIIGSLPMDSSMPFIIMSTVSPVEMKELRSTLDKSGRGSIRLTDSPVSGLPLLAEAGKLSLMFGGDRVLYDELMPLFEAMADPEKIFYMGSLGSGSAMKLVNNMIGFTASLAACEAMDLGVRGGLSTEMMARVIDVSSGKNFITDQWQLSRKLFEAMLSGADQTAKDAVFTTGQKDLGIAGEWAEKIGVRLEISEIAVKHMKSIDNEKFESVLRNLVKK
jgi:3-hydroxyisobutyrate dehydrogenase